MRECLVPISVYHMHASFHRKPERVSDPLELNLQAVVTNHMLGMKPWTSARAASLLTTDPLNGSFIIRVDFIFLLKLLL